jgi:outer membrane receptor protein involved in Fe transport
MTAGKGFRAPSVAEMFTAVATSGYTVVPNPDLVPERVWGGEVGGSWTPLPFMRVEGSLFRNRYTSMIEGVARGDGNIQFQNVSSAVLQGAELGVLASIPAGWLRGGFSYLWLSARDENGVQLAYRRPRRGTATVELVGGWWSLAADLLYGGAIGRTALYRYERRIPMYRLDGRLTLEVLGQRLIVQGRNLTRYVWTDIERNLTPPREWSLSIERSWQDD